jgi:hypothetical protein
MSENDNYKKLKLVESDIEKLVPGFIDQLEASKKCCGFLQTEILPLFKNTDKKELLKLDLPSALKQMLDNKPPHHPGQTEINIRREPCLDCVYKHLSKARIVAGEMISGYAFEDILMKNLQEAMKQAPEGLRKQLQPLMMLARTNRLSNLFESITEILKESGNYPKWKLVGELSEAEDECADEEIRNMLRMIRLDVMNGQAVDKEMLDEIEGKIQNVEQRRQVLHSEGA